MDTQTTITDLTFNEVIMQEVSFNKWENPSTGEIRYYVNESSYAGRKNLHYLLGGVTGTDFSKAGNLASAEAWEDDEWGYISNSKANKRKLENGEKVYYNTLSGQWIGVEKDFVIEALNEAFIASQDSE